MDEDYGPQRKQQRTIVHKRAVAIQLRNEAISRRMRCVRAANTRPEIIVRQLLRSLGYRYRLHDRKLSGRPDIVLSSKRCVIWVHGCFWHRHENCRRTTTPKQHLAFWLDKFKKNVERDRLNIRKLCKDHWRCMVVWECQTSYSNLPRLRQRLLRFLEAKQLSKKLSNRRR